METHSAGKTHVLSVCGGNLARLRLRTEIEVEVTAKDDISARTQYGEDVLQRIGSVVGRPPVKLRGGHC